MYEFIVIVIVYINFVVYVRLNFSMEKGVGIEF